MWCDVCVCSFEGKSGSLQRKETEQKWTEQKKKNEYRNMYAKWQILRNIPHDQTMRMKHEHTLRFWLAFIGFSRTLFCVESVKFYSLLVFCLLNRLIQRICRFFPSPNQMRKTADGKEDFELSMFQPSRLVKKTRVRCFCAAVQFRQFQLVEWGDEDRSVHGSRVYVEFLVQ